MTQRYEQEPDLPASSLSQDILSERMHDVDLRSEGPALRRPVCPAHPLFCRLRHATRMADRTETGCMKPVAMAGANRCRKQGCALVRAAVGRTRDWAPPVVKEAVRQAGTGASWLKGGAIFLAANR